MQTASNKQTKWMESMVFTVIGMAAFYWICESFMFFFLSPEANLFHHLFGPDIFEIWTRLLVLCIFVIFGSHVQYNLNNRRIAYEELREQDEKYRVIIENIDEGFFEVDLAGNFSFFNNSVCKILVLIQPILIFVLLILPFLTFLYFALYCFESLKTNCFHYVAD